MSAYTASSWSVNEVEGTNTHSGTESGINLVWRFVNKLFIQAAHDSLLFISCKQPCFFLSDSSSILCFDVMAAFVLMSFIRVSSSELISTLRAISAALTSRRTCLRSLARSVRRRTSAHFTYFINFWPVPLSSRSTNFCLKMWAATSFCHKVISQCPASRRVKSSAQHCRPCRLWVFRTRISSQSSRCFQQCFCSVSVYQPFGLTIDRTRWTQYRPWS